MDGVRRGEGDEARPAVRVVWSDARPGSDGIRTARWRWILLVLALVGVGTVVGWRAAGGDETPATTVPARALSEPEAVTVDATTVDRAIVDGGWQIVELGFSVQFGDIASTGDGFVAVGSDIDGPGLWSSLTGESWTLSKRLDVAEAVAALAPPVHWRSIPWQLEMWNGAVVAVGSVGTSRGVWIDGEFGGFIGEPRLASWSRVVFGESLLTVVDNEWLMSNTGDSWTPIEPQGLPGGMAYLVGFVDGFYYADGGRNSSACTSDHLYRSVDGVRWEVAAMESVAVEEPEFLILNGFATTNGVPISVGGIEDTPDQVRPGFVPGLWKHAGDGGWERCELGELFEPHTTTFELVRVNTVGGAATVAVSGVEYSVPEGSVIATDAGDLLVESVRSDGIAIRGGTAGWTLLRPGTKITLLRRPGLGLPVSNGAQVAILGALISEDPENPRLSFSVPTVWVSDDACASWTELSINEPERLGHVAEIAISDDTIVLIGATEDTATVVWHRNI